MTSEPMTSKAKTPTPMTSTPKPAMPTLEPSPDHRHLKGAFDIIGDVHGCAGELEELLARLGYGVVWPEGRHTTRPVVTAPQGRKAVFVGDLVDRGPRSPDVLRIVMAFVRTGQGLAVPGNHDIKFLRWIDGKQVKLTHGLDRTVDQFTSESPEFKAEVREFLAGLPSYLWLAGGRLAVAHAGIKEDMLGHDSQKIRNFCLYGDTSGETDETGLPVRYHWAADYRGSTEIVYGHTPVPDADWVNNTICIDTGCCFGAKLTALRYPEREIVTVDAHEEYTATRRPFGHPPVRPAAAPG